MRYDFSSAFLIIKPPATSFGEAWEHLCTDLLAAEHGTLGGHPKPAIEGHFKTGQR
jgi:hypothetical protein